MTRIPELEQELVAAAGRLQSPRRVLRPAARVALVSAAVLLVVVLLVVDATDRDGRDSGRQPNGTPSQRGTKVGIDVSAGVRFSLTGRQLTVSVLSWAPFETRQKVSGARIRATCGVAYAQVGPEGDPRNAREERTRLWPGGRKTLSFRFARDISRNARWCRVEDPTVGNVGFVRFGIAPVHIGSQEQRIALGANEWARLFAASDTRTCDEYMTQPACERMACERVASGRIENCTPPSTAYRRSFRDARVQEIAIRGETAAARFSNGETVVLVKVADGAWLIHRFGGTAGRQLLSGN